MISLDRFKINNLLFISFFTIFFHLIPIGVETQPHFTLVLAVLLFVTAKKTSLGIKKDIFFLYILISILFIYAFLQFFYEIDKGAILELIKYIIGPIIYLAIRNNAYQISYKIFSYVVYTLTVFALLNLLYPSIYEFIFQLFIPRFSGNQPGGLRGITILTPEPSYFAVFQVILLITIEKQLAFVGVQYNETKKLKKLKYLVLILSIFTKSALVLILSLIFILPSNINFKKALKIILISIIGIFIILNIYSENRLFQIVSILFNLIRDGNFDLVSYLFTQESSGGTRLIVNFLAISSVFIKPFGSGLGSFSDMLIFYGSYFNLDIASHEVLGGELISKIYPQTYFASLCNDIGIFSFLLIPIILLNNDNSNKAYNLKRILCLLVLIFFQSQITNPAFWFLLALSKISHDKKILK